MSDTAQIEEILHYYSTQSDRSEQSMIVAMLRELQECTGCLTPSIQQQAANAAGVPVSIVSTLIRFHSDLKTTCAKHEIVVCSGARCASNQAGALLSFLHKELKPNQHGLSENGLIMLRTQNCFKQCRSGPNIRIDGTLHSGMTPEALQQLLRTLA